MWNAFGAKSQPDRAGKDHLHLPDAPGSKTGYARHLLKMWDGPGTPARRGQPRGGRPRVARHDQKVLGIRGLGAARPLVGDVADVGRAARSMDRPSAVSLDSVCLEHPGCALGWLAIFPAWLAVAGHVESEHVHVDLAGNGSSLLLQPRRPSATEGRPRLTEVIPTGQIPESEVLGLAASIEQNSEHPLGRAIVDAARDRNISLSPVEGFDSITGGGVQGQVAGRMVLVGKRAFLEQNNLQNVAVWDERAKDLQR